MISRLSNTLVIKAIIDIFRKERDVQTYYNYLVEYVWNREKRKGTKEREKNQTYNIPSYKTFSNWSSLNYQTIRKIKSNVLEDWFENEISIKLIKYRDEIAIRTIVEAYHLNLIQSLDDMNIFIKNMYNIFSDKECWAYNLTESLLSTDSNIFKWSDISSNTNVSLYIAQIHEKVIAILGINSIEPPKKAEKLFIKYRDNDDYIEREGYIKKIELAWETRKYINISGLGGVGKSQLAAYYARKGATERFLGGIYWIECEKGIFDGLFNFCVEYNEIIEGKNFEETKLLTVNGFRKRILEQESVLFILDNIQRPLEIFERMNTDYDVTTFNCSIISTSRLECSGSTSIHSIEIQDFNEGECFKLYSKMTGRSTRNLEYNEKETAKDIFNFVGRLPLALVQIFTFLNINKKVTLSEYHEAMLKEGSIVRADESVNLDSEQDRHAFGLKVVLRITLDKIKSEDVNFFLAVATAFPETNTIPYCRMQFATAFDFEEGNKLSVVMQTLKTWHIIECLDNNDFQIHALIREFVLNYIPKEKDFENRIDTAYNTTYSLPGLLVHIIKERGIYALINEGRMAKKILGISENEINIKIDSITDIFSNRINHFNGDKFKENNEIWRNHLFQLIHDCATIAGYAELIERTENYLLDNEEYVGFLDIEKDVLLERTEQISFNVIKTHGIRCFMDATHSYDGKYILIANENKFNIRVVEVENNETKYYFNGHKDKISKVVCGSNSSLVASVSEDGHIIIWDILQNRIISRFNFDISVESIKFLENDSYILISGKAGQIIVQNIFEGSDCVVIANNSPIKSLTCSDNGEIIAFLCSRENFKNYIFVYEKQNEYKIRRFVKLDEFEMKALCCSNDGTYILAIGLTKKCALINTVTNQKYNRNLFSGSELFNSEIIQINYDGKFVITFRDDRTIMIDSNRIDELSSIDYITDHSSSSAINAHKGTIAVCVRNGVIEIFSSRRGDYLQKFETGLDSIFYRVEFADYGKKLIAYSFDEILIIDMQKSLKEKDRLVYQENFFDKQISNAMISDSGDKVAVVFEGHIEIVNLATKSKEVYDGNKFSFDSAIERIAKVGEDTIEFIGSNNFTKKDYLVERCIMVDNDKAILFWVNFNCEYNLELVKFDQSHDRYDRISGVSFPGDGSLIQATKINDDMISIFLSNGRMIFWNYSEIDTYNEIDFELNRSFDYTSFSNDLKYLLGFCFDDNEVYILNISENKINNIGPYEYQISYALFSENSSRLILRLRNSNLLITDLYTRRNISNFKIHSRFNLEDKLLITAQNKSGRLVCSFSDWFDDEFIKVFVWDTKLMKKIYTFSAHSKNIKGVMYSKNDSRLLSYSDKEVCVWDSSLNQDHSEFKGSNIERIIVDSNHRWAISYNDDDIVSLWDINKKEFISTILIDHRNSLKFDKQGENILGFDKNGEICLIKLNTLQTTFISKFTQFESNSFKQAEINEEGTIIIRMPCNFADKLVCLYRKDMITNEFNKIEKYLHTNEYIHDGIFISSGMSEYFVTLYYSEITVRSTYDFKILKKFNAQVDVELWKEIVSTSLRNKFGVKGCLKNNNESFFELIELVELTPKSTLFQGYLIDISEDRFLLNDNDFLIVYSLYDGKELCKFSLQGYRVFVGKIISEGKLIVTYHAVNSSLILWNSINGDIESVFYLSFDVLDIMWDNSTSELIIIGKKDNYGIPIFKKINIMYNLKDIEIK